MSATRPERPGAQQWVPDLDDADIEDLRHAAVGCRGCELWEAATQVVFSAGPPSARMVLVGEQPGDREDREGVPFVGPAGRLLSQALEDAGIDRDIVYVTNAVKHFRFRQAAPGKRRIHQTPDLAQMTACKPWLDAELALVAPQVVVCLGATAAKSLLGRDFRVTKQRGEVLIRETAVGPTRLVATVHPSSILRGSP
ncbi:MAG: UdgX family uracil-DNA binding protein, partial [Actinomycetes bacterium]